MKLTRRDVLRAGGILAAGAAVPTIVPRGVALAGADQVVLRHHTVTLAADGRGRARSGIVAAGVFSLFAVRDTDLTDVRVRVGDGGHLGAWRQIPSGRPTGHGDVGDGASGVPSADPTWTGPATHFQVDAERGGTVTVVTIDPGADPLRRADADEPVVPRTAWGADESMRRRDPATAEAVRFGVVHHTYTSNDYDEGDVPAILRAIYAYHVNEHNWLDIGYNFVVDRFGTVYEGRVGSVNGAVVGSHAVRYNNASVGVSLLGDYTATTPAREQLDAAAWIIAAVFDRDGVDPTQWVDYEIDGNVVTLPSVTSHRDVGDTRCPGDRAYAELDTIRVRVEELSGTLEGVLTKSHGEVARIGGRDAVETATLVSSAAFPDAGSARHAVVATLNTFADAAAGGPLAGADGPVLLTDRDDLDPRVHAELTRVLPEGHRVWVLGSTSALSDTVVDRLTPRWDVKRLAGDDRVGTSLAVAEQVVAEHGRDVAFVARAFPNDAWADSLTAGAYGARAGVPVVLVRDRDIDRVVAALEQLGVTRTVVVGGTSAVSDEIADALPDPWRAAGATREETAERIAADVWGHRDGQFLLAGAWRPTAWRDALVAAPLAALRDAPVLVTHHEQLGDAAARHLRERGRYATLLGGTAALSEDVAEQTSRALG